MLIKNQNNVLNVIKNVLHVMDQLEIIVHLVSNILIEFIINVSVKMAILKLMLNNVQNVQRNVKLVITSLLIVL